MSDAVYDVRLSGLVPMRDLVRELGETVAIAHEMRTVVTGRFGDQEDLHRILHRLRAFGLEVVEVRRVAADEPAPDSADAPTNPPATGARMSRPAGG